MKKAGTFNVIGSGDGGFMVLPRFRLGNMVVVRLENSDRDLIGREAS